jgi:hypothetical protein
MIKNFNDFLNEELNERKSWDDLDVKKIAKQFLKDWGPKPDRDDLEQFLNDLSYSEKLEDDSEDFEYELKKELGW